MPNATISTMVTDLATVTVDATAVNNYEDEIIFELSRGAFPGCLVQTGASFTQAIKNQGTYSLPTVDSARTVLMLMFDTTQLARSRKDEGWMLDPAWRTSPKSKPLAYVTDPENRTDYTLIPPPNTTGDDPTGITPLDETFPSLDITVVYAKTDLTFATGPYRDILLPIAFETLSRELGRDSDHQDKVASDVASKLADFFLSMAFPERVVQGLKTGTS